MAPQTRPQTEASGSGGGVCALRFLIHAPLAGLGGDAPAAFDVAEDGVDFAVAYRA